MKRSLHSTNQKNREASGIEKGQKMYENILVAPLPDDLNHNLPQKFIMVQEDEEGHDFVIHVRNAPERFYHRSIVKEVGANMNLKVDLDTLIWKDENDHVFQKGEVHGGGKVILAEDGYIDVIDWRSIDFGRIAPRIQYSIHSLLQKAYAKHFELVILSRR